MQDISKVCTKNTIFSFGLEQHNSKSFCDTFKAVKKFLRQVMGSGDTAYVAWMWTEVFDAQYSKIYNLFNKIMSVVEW
jgi:hypothetical protein